MQHKKEFFKPVDPFTLQPELYSRHYEKELRLSIRPVCLLTDLDFLYDWINPPVTRYPPVFKKIQRPIVMHYKKILESSYAQSLLIEKDAAPLCQLDILPCQQDELHLSFYTQAEDCILRYLLPNKKYPDCDFRDALDLFLAYYYSFLNIGLLYLPVPASDISLNQQVTETGFQQCAKIELKETLLTNLYKINGP